MSHYILMDEDSRIKYQGNDLEEFKRVRDGLARCYLVEVWKDSKSVGISETELRKIDIIPGWEPIGKDSSVMIPIESRLATLLLGELNI